MTKILFVGLGIMGFPIASHLLRKYKSISVFNRTIKKSEKFKKKFSDYKVNIFKELEHINEHFEFIISCVGNDKDLENIYFSKNGLSKNIRSGGYIIDHTTASQKKAISLSNRFIKKKSYFFDAPVSGGESGAQSGKLSIMVGGNKGKFKKIKKILDVYSKSSVYMGVSGNGQITKMVNQICITGLIQTLAEGINFGKKNGLELNSMLSAIGNGAAQSWQMDNRAKTMWNNKFNFGFMNKLMVKDLKIIVDQSKINNLDIPITKKILSRYILLLKNGHENLDTSSLIKLLN